MRYSNTFKQTTTMNELIDLNRSNKFAAANKKNVETQAIAKQVSDAPSFDSQVYVCFEFTYKNSQADLDNVQSSKKSVLDGLVAAKVLKQDNFNWVKPISFDVFKKADEKLVTVHIFDDKHEYLDFVNYLLSVYS